jgi:hypothetical protein
MRNVWMVASLIGLVVLPCPGQTEGGNRGELKVCDHRTNNGADSSAYVKSEQVSQACKDAVQKALDACFKNPDHIDFDQVAEQKSIRPGTVGSQDAITQLYAETRDRISGYAQACEDAKKPMEQACSGISQNLKQALADNSQGMKAAQNDLAQMDATNPSRAAKIQQVKDYHDVSLQLQGQISANNLAIASVDKALKDQAECYTSQAVLYAQAHDTVNTNVARADESSNDIEEDRGVKEKLEDYGVDDFDVKVAKAGVGQVESIFKSGQLPEGATSIAEEAGEVAEKEGSLAGRAIESVDKVGGVAFPLLAVANGDYGEALNGASGTIAEYAMSPTAAARVSGVGTFIYAMTDATELGKCDVNMYDPVVAYNAKCALTTEQALTAMAGH